MQIAAEAADSFPGGLYFVPLATVSDPPLVAGTIAHALGLQEAGTKPTLEVIAAYLGQRRTLLVLDNFEQLLAAAPVVSDLLRACAGVKAIVTSRAALRVSGEQEFPVPPLGLPEPGSLPSLDVLSGYEALRLFCERAGAVKPDFQLTSDNASAVAAICARLDGLPLAIELAAARIKLLPPQAMLQRLEQGLKALGTGARDLPERQQTLYGAISWSCDLLDAPGRRLFSRFSVFVRGATLEAAETVCGPAEELGFDILDGLETLIDNSLLRQREEDGEPRFWMLVTIRNFAFDRLTQSAEGDAVRGRHADVYLALAQAAEPFLQSPDQKSWLDRLEREHDNLRAALAWLQARGEVERAMYMAAALWRFWQVRGHLREGRERLEALLAQPESKSSPAARLKALEAAGGTAYWQGDWSGAGRAFYEEALELARQLGDPYDVSNAAYNLGFSHVSEPALRPAGRKLLDEALAGFRELGKRKDVARVLWGISAFASTAGAYEEASRAIIEALQIQRGSDDAFGLGWTLRQAGTIAIKQQQLDQARGYLAEALQLFYGFGDISAATILMGDLAEIAQQQGDYPRAARLAGAGAALTKQLGATISEIADKLQGRDLTAGGLSAEDFQRYWDEGQAMGFDAAVAYALEAGKDRGHRTRQ
jgi:predicted ATPase